jgi:hypothetical protein
VTTRALVVVGSDRDTPKVAAALGLRSVAGSTRSRMVVVASTAADVDALRDAVHSGSEAIAAVVALRLDEALVVALYDLGLPVAFGFCTRDELDAAIAAAPDADGRAVAATLASVEHALATRVGATA